MQLEKSTWKWILRRDLHWNLPSTGPTSELTCCPQNRRNRMASFTKYFPLAAWQSTPLENGNNEHSFIQVDGARLQQQTRWHHRCENTEEAANQMAWFSKSSIGSSLFLKFSHFPKKSCVEQKLRIFVPSAFYSSTFPPSAQDGGQQVEALPKKKTNAQWSECIFHFIPALVAFLYSRLISFSSHAKAPKHDRPFPF